MKEKWWWVCRRVRETYEDFTPAMMQKGCSFKSLTGAWSLVLLEVYLRCCRDLAAVRYAVMEKMDYDEAELAALQNAMNKFANVQQIAVSGPLWRLSCLKAMNLQVEWRLF